MDFLEGIPTGIWQLPLPTLVFVLLATGVLVTRREHNNMKSMMEYFRALCDKKDGVISTQVETIHVLREGSVTAKKIVESIQEVAKGEPDVSSEK